MGAPIGAAAAYDLAFLAALFGALLGSYHGARSIEAEGLGVDAYAAMLAAATPAIGGMLERSTLEVHAGEFAAAESSLEICWRGMELLARQAREAGIDATFAEFAASTLRRGVEAGFGAESPAAMIKVLRGGGR